MSAREPAGQERLAGPLIAAETRRALLMQAAANLRAPTSRTPRYSSKYFPRELRLDVPEIDVISGMSRILTLPRAPAASARLALPA